MEKLDYIYIRAWHLMTGSYQYYINMVISEARRDDAPENAIYYDGRSREWRTVDDIVSPKTKAEVTAFAERLRSGSAVPEAGKETP